MNTTTPSTPHPPANPARAPRSRSQRPGGRRILARLAWIAGYAAVRGAATTAGGAAVTALIWWIHNR